LITPPLPPQKTNSQKPEDWDNETSGKKKKKNLSQLPHGRVPASTTHGAPDIVSLSLKWKLNCRTEVVVV
jgi:hypothetical protein